MTKEEFSKFVEKTIDELLLYAQLCTEQEFLGFQYFIWERKDATAVFGIQNIVNEIVSKVYVSESEIYPCVDLTVFKASDGENIFFSARIMGFSPRPFQKNGYGRLGQFVSYIDSKIISPNIDTKDKKFVQKLIDTGLLDPKPLEK